LHNQGRGDGHEAGTSGSSEADRAPLLLPSPQDPRENFGEILNAALCDLVHIFVANANIIVSKYFESIIIFYQRVSIASYASAGIARAEMSVRLSVRHTPVLYQNEDS